MRVLLACLAIRLVESLTETPWHLRMTIGRSGSKLPDGWQAHVHSLNRLHHTIVGQSGHGASPPDLLPADLRSDPSHCAFASALEQELAWRCVVGRPRPSRAPLSHARALSRALTAKFNLVAANAWLALTVELLGCGVSASVVIFALGERLLWPGEQQGNRLQKYEDAGFLGLSLSYALSSGNSRLLPSAIC